MVEVGSGAAGGVGEKVLIVFGFNPGMEAGDGRVKNDQGIGGTAADVDFSVEFAAEADAVLLDDE